MAAVRRTGQIKRCQGVQLYRYHVHLCVVNLSSSACSSTVAYETHNLVEVSNRQSSQFKQDCIHMLGMCVSSFDAERKTRFLEFTGVHGIGFFSSLCLLPSPFIFIILSMTFFSQTEVKLCFVRATARLYSSFF